MFGVARGNGDFTQVLADLDRQTDRQHDPVVVGQRVLQAIRDQDVNILTHATERAAAQARLEGIIAAFDRADSRS